MTNTILRAATETITPDALNQTLANIKASLAEGGIGIGAPIGYLPKTNPNEMFQVYKLAGELQALVFSHVRQPDIISIQEAIADAVLTGAPLHIVHINSMSLGNIGLSLEMVNAANKKVLTSALSCILIPLVPLRCKAPCLMKVGNKD